MASISRGYEELGAYRMDDSNGQLNFEMFAGVNAGKLGPGREPYSVDLLERAGDLNVQEVAYAKESP